MQISALEMRRSNYIKTITKYHACRKPLLVPPENRDVAERFRATAQLLPWSATFAQLWQISGCFCANNLPFWGDLGANWTSEHP